MTVRELRARLDGIPDHLTIVLNDPILKGGYFVPIEDIHVFDMVYLGDNLYTSRDESGEPEQAVLIQ